MTQITSQIIAAAVERHRTPGPGLLESAYEACLAHEIQKRGLKAPTLVGLIIDFNLIRLVDGIIRRVN